MERDAAMSKKLEMKLDIPREAEAALAGGLGGGGGGGGGGLARQRSITKNNCLCSPTTHAGSFRCRLHRAPTPSFQRTKSIDSTSIQDSQSKPSNHNQSAQMMNHGGTVEAQ